MQQRLVADPFGDRGVWSVFFFDIVVDILALILMLILILLILIILIILVIILSILIVVDILIILILINVKVNELQSLLVQLLDPDTVVDLVFLFVLAEFVPQEQK